MDQGSSKLEQAPLNNAAGFLAKTERKIMGFTFWFCMLILVHVAFLFMVPWE